MSQTVQELLPIIRELSFVLGVASGSICVPLYFIFSRQRG